MYLKLILPAFLALSFSCKTKNSSQYSNTKLVRGYEDNISYPSVVKLKIINSAGEELNFCTGTFINYFVLVTAAHCFNYGEPVKVYVDDQVSEDVLIPSQYSRSNLEYDIAFVRFKMPQLKGFIPLGLGFSIQENDLGVLVGYGHNSYDVYYDFGSWNETSSLSSKAGVRRLATNTYKIDKQIKEGFIRFEGESYGWDKEKKDISISGKDGLLGEGDSGGPLIIGAEINANGTYSGGVIIGIASHTAINELKEKNRMNSYHLFINAPQLQEFLKLARTRGYITDH